MTDVLVLCFAFLVVGSMLASVVRPDRFIGDARQESVMLVLLFAGVPILLAGMAAAGLRPLTAGFDTPNYVFAYMRIGSPFTAVADGARYFGNTELLWWPLQSLLRPFLDPAEWLAANFLIVVVLVLCSYRRVCAAYGLNPGLSVLVFATFFIVYAGNGMRQALAIPLGAMAVFRYFEGRHNRAVCMVALAIGLHWSSIVLLIIPALSCRWFNRRLAYVVPPLICLAASSLMSGFVLMVTETIGFAGFSDKYNLYFTDHDSHIGQVWQTANFWLCVLVSFLFLASWPGRGASKALPAFVCLYLSLVLFGVQIPDFSERYLPALLFAMPLMVALVIRQTRLPALLKSVALMACFAMMAPMVYLNESAQLTLGFHIT